jgi:hypothetical protein
MRTNVVKVSIKGMKPGNMITVEWKNKPIVILKRSKAILKSIDNITEKTLAPYSTKKKKISQNTQRMPIAQSEKTYLFL